jgi:hypothetical protein
MSNSFLRVLSKLPLVGSVAGKFARTDTRLHEVERDLRLLSAEMYFPRKISELRALFALLRPMKAIGINKIRVGAKNDGGYVMLDDFNSVSGAYSLGIADDVTWDLEIAGRGIKVEQFDYSITKSPVEHPLFTFSQKKIVEIKDILKTPAEGRILKLDIEGSEWGFFETVTAGEMKSFNQIMGEFHYFSFYYKQDWYLHALRALQKINETHQLVHIHGNNGGNAFWAGDVQVPDLIELTFALRSKYQFEASPEAFPGSLDSPNQPAREDYPAGPLLKSFLRQS